MRITLDNRAARIAGRLFLHAAPFAVQHNGIVGIGRAYAFVASEGFADAVREGRFVTGAWIFRLRHSDPHECEPESALWFHRHDADGIGRALCDAREPVEIILRGATATVAGQRFGIVAKGPACVFKLPRLDDRRATFRLPHAAQAVACREVSKILAGADNDAAERVRSTACRVSIVERVTGQVALHIADAQEIFSLTVPVNEED